MFAPVPGTKAADDRSGILAYHFEISDDGTSALVEFVAADRSALEPIVASKARGMRVFERGQGKQDDIESEFKRLKREFRLEKFIARMP